MTKKSSVSILMMILLCMCSLGGTVFADEVSDIKPGDRKIAGSTGQEVREGEYLAEVLKDNTVVITKFDSHDSACPAIPEEIGGYPVSAIGKNALQYKEFKELIIPNTVTIIEKGAFYNASIENSIVFPDSVQIDKEAFYSASLPEEVTIPSGAYVGKEAFSYCDGMEILNLMDGVYLDETAFYNAEDLTELYLSAGIMIGEEAFYSCDEIEIIEEYEKNEETADTSTIIEEEAFAYCTGFKSVLIPKDVITIEKNAFYNCEIKESLVFPENIYIDDEAFYSCEYKGDLIIPAGAELGSKVFAYAEKIKNITIGDNAIIGDDCFYNAPDVESLVIGNNVEIGDEAFYSCDKLMSVSIGNNVTMGDEVFAYCSKLKDSIDATSAIDSEDKEDIGKSISNEGELIIEYEIQDDKAVVVGYSGSGKQATISSKYEGYDVVAVAESALEGCTDLQSVLFWADIESIGESAFKDCVSLTKISIPSETTIIGAHAFENCEQLVDLIIWGDPDIGDYAFANCVSLDEISIGSDTEYLGAHAFENCTGAETLILWGDPDIGDYAFANCTGLDEISIGSDTKYIGAHAFENCTGVDTLIFWGIEEIGEYAFAGCTGIEDISFPSEAQLVRAHAFDGCTALETVTVWGDTKFEKDAFKDCPSLENAPAEIEISTPRETTSVETDSNLQIEEAFPEETVAKDNTDDNNADMVFEPQDAFKEEAAVPNLSETSENNSSSEDIQEMSDTAMIESDSVDAQESDEVTSASSSVMEEPEEEVNEIEEDSEVNLDIDESSSTEEIIESDSVQENEIDYSSTEIILKVQTGLNANGYDCGTPDGISGAKTKEAITRYREENELPPGDYIDYECLVSLGISLPSQDETQTKENDEFKKLMGNQYPTESELKEFADKYAGEKIEFDGCIAYKENNDGVLIYYGNYVGDFPESGPEMTTWDTNIGKEDVASNIDLSGFNVGDNVHVTVIIKPYKQGTSMYSVRLEEITHR